MLAKLLTDHDVVRFGQFTLTSGATSDHYVDIKMACCQPIVLDAIARATANMFEGQRFDVVAGMELGAVPYATAVSLAAKVPMAIVRKGERTHGTGRAIEGIDVSGKNVAVVEDVTTSGGSLVTAVERLRAAGATVEKAYVVVDRAGGAIERMANIGVQLVPLVHVAQLLELRPESTEVS